MLELEAFLTEKSVPQAWEGRDRRAPSDGHAPVEPGLSAR